MPLGHGADVNLKRGSFGTALHAASSRGHSAVVEILLCSGADVNAINLAFETSLYLAAREGYHTII